MAQVDQYLSERIIKRFLEVRAEMGKPKRVFKNDLLGADYGCYWRYGDRLPIARALVDGLVEGIQSSRLRRIEWAVHATAKGGELISANSIRRVTGIDTPLVTQFRPYVLELARRFGYGVHPQF
jgi:hypothetical protein